MTQEDRELLLKDLCGRLPYGVIFKDECDENLHKIYYIRDEDIYTRTYPNLPSWIETIKPYLRPMSSITDEEQKELSIILNYEFYVDDDFALVAEDNRHRIRLELCNGYTDWLNKYMFDYRGLILRGLAIEAPKGMYN